MHKKQENQPKQKLRQLSENEFLPSNGLEIITSEESFLTLANNQYWWRRWPSTGL